MSLVPATMAGLADRGPDWERWLADLPRIADEVATEWELMPSGDAMHGETALVLPVRDADGTRLVLKLAFVEGDNAGEIPALKAWRGLGAVRLERADPKRGALLLERLSRRDLGALADIEAAALVGGLYRRLHVPAPPTVPRLAPLVRNWLAALADLGRDVPAPPRFVEQALHAGRSLLADAHLERTQRPKVPQNGPSRAASALQVLHGDLHYGNVLAARREPWLVIDPKGFAGDPCFEPAPLLWNRWDELLATGDAGGAVRERFYAIVDAAAYDERRCRDWVVVRAMIGVSWEVEDARRAGRPLSPEQRGLITRYVTVAKAMQSVAADAW